jgi:hypothetical protein
MESMRSTWTDSRLDDFVISVDRRFDTVDRRFDAVDRHFASVDRRFDRLDARFDSLQRTMMQIGGGIIAALIGVIVTQL